MAKKMSVIAICILLLSAFAGCSAADPAAGSEGDKSALTSDSSAAASASGAPSKTVKITVGYQSPTAQTWGALIMKHNKLYEKHLKEAEPDTAFEVQWFDAPAGAVLNNNMIGGKIQMAFMGDLPLLLNGMKGLTQDNYRSVFLAFDGKGVMGVNQAVIVPKDSDLKDIKELAGRTVSTPIGSSAHRMLLDALKQNDLTDKVKIVDQSVTVGMQSVEQNKIAAHSTWEPYPSLIMHKDTAKVLYDGAETKIDYLDGVVANLDWVNENKAYTVAFIKALFESHEFIRENPAEAADIFAQESGFPLEVCMKLTKTIRFDAAVYDRDIETLKGSIEFLRSIGKVEKELDVEKFIDVSYLEEAASSAGKPYLTDEQRKSDYIDGLEF
ncbi:ABC transporter substrate-binding protein [Paenibacillus alkalitolerans]|uniref:ABC transporter substrate-binding protein n=1 Tax=Paenibacillus alkalitolerans TaxID=2799335 RepID=UPI001F189F20|nr:ABC transporter substrate-binding protein [Paenibacillus alkalitolerans]